MGQRRIIEVNYSEFKSILEYAVNQRNTIDPADKEAWKAFVRKHDVPEAGFRSRANGQSMSGETKAVIIEGSDRDDGYYLYSPDDQFSMKFESGKEYEESAGG